MAVGDYDSVKENQLVVTLDDDEMQAQLLQMEADYKSSEADILNAKASLNTTTTSTTVNKGNITLAQVKKSRHRKTMNATRNYSQTRQSQENN